MGRLEEGKHILLISWKASLATTLFFQTTLLAAGSIQYDLTSVYFSKGHLFDVTFSQKPHTATRVMFHLPFDRAKQTNKQTENDPWQYGICRFTERRWLVGQDSNSSIF